MIVVKVGGSLYDLPDLGSRLARVLVALGDTPRLLVPGGGAAADVIRDLDKKHLLGPLKSHWLALRVCAVNAYFLQDLLPGVEVVCQPPREGVAILDPYLFALADEGREGCLPHCWDATSDSVAARVAEWYGADLVLLKSVEAENDWEKMARHGVVDSVFPGIIARSGIVVRTINARAFGG